MSKTFARVYARGYRAGRRLTPREKAAFFLKHKRTDVEEWITDYETGSADFFIFAVLGVCVGGILALALLAAA